MREYYSKRSFQDSDTSDRRLRGAVRRIGMTLYSSVVLCRQIFFPADKGYSVSVFGLIVDFEIPLLLWKVFAQTPITGARMAFHSFDSGNT